MGFYDPVCRHACTCTGAYSADGAGKILTESLAAAMHGPAPAKPTTQASPAYKLVADQPLSSQPAAGALTDAQVAQVANSTGQQHSGHMRMDANLADIEKTHSVSETPAGACR